MNDYVVGDGGGCRGFLNVGRSSAFAFACVVFSMRNTLLHLADVCTSSQSPPQYCFFYMEMVDHFSGLFCCVQNPVNACWING